VGLYLINRETALRPFLSFKLIIENSYLNKILVSTFWPNGIKIRPWIFNPKSAPSLNPSSEPPTKKLLIQSQIISDQSQDSHFPTKVLGNEVSQLDKIPNWASEVEGSITNGLEV